VWLGNLILNYYENGGREEERKRGREEERKRGREEERKRGREEERKRTYFLIDYLKPHELISSNL
jgi:hypothetical protein